ncbi:MAG: hypothetical protein U0840_08155 [Gemmataceae bacterium]
MVGLVPLMLALTLATSQAKPDEVEIPLVGRPADLPFSGACAGFVVDPAAEAIRVPFTLEVRASPTSLDEQQTVRLAVIVRAQGDLRSPPSRLDLQTVAGFQRRFHIEDVTESPASAGTGKAWTWIYRLRPKSREVHAIPGVPLVYFNPDLRPGEKGFQILWSDPIPLEVRPTEQNALPVEVPEVALTFQAGDGLLRKVGPMEPPSPVMLTLALTAPPVVCLVWYLVWRWRYPDAAAQARRRQGQAARQALASLRSCRGFSGHALGEAVAACLAGYLAARFGLEAHEPTPADLVHLTAWGVAPEEVAGLVARCAALRFQPTTVQDATLIEATSQWILRQEEHLCMPRPS